MHQDKEVHVVYNAVDSLDEFDGSRGEARGDVRCELGLA